MHDEQFDSENKNIKWYDAIKLEMAPMIEYKVSKKWDKAILDKHKKVTNPPKGYHRIKVHLVFAVKFDGRHKARLVADELLYKRFVLVYKQYTKLITAHESITTNPKYTYILCIYGL